MAAKTKSPKEIFTSLVTQLTNSYPNLNGGDPSSWVLYNDDFSQTSVQLEQVCHARLAYSWCTKAGFTTLLTAMPKTDDLSREYLNMIIAGPFRSMQDKISIEEFNGKYYIKCSDLKNWPANVLSNFCIATRVPIERPNWLEDWKKLEAAGVDTVLAFLLVPYEFTGVDTPVKGPTYNINHLFFDCTSSYKRLLAGEFSQGHLSKSFFEAPHQSFPTNVIWGVQDMNERKLMAGKTPLELNEAFGLTKPPEPVVVEDKKQTLEEYVAMMHKKKMIYFEQLKVDFDQINPWPHQQGQE